MIILIMFHLKFMLFDDLVTEAWVVIILGFISYAIGVLIVFPIIKLGNRLPVKHLNPSFFGFSDNQFKLLIFIFGAIGLLGAIQHWMVLMRMFGGVQEVLIAANIIYAMRVEGGLPDVLPYLSFFSFAGTLLVGARIAFRGKLGFIDILPIIALILKEIANFGRAGILQGFSELFIGFIICRTIVKYYNIEGQKINVKNIALAVLILLTLVISSTSTVRFFRGTTENYKQSSRELGAMRSNLILTPSIYLYASGHIGVLSKYLAQNNETASFGENTFLPVYHVLAKFHFSNKTGFYQKPYFIPVWINTGTYLREIHADFGIAGVLIIPFLLGFFSTYYWFKVRQTASPYQFVILTGLLTIVTMSFLVMITRDANFILTNTLLLCSFGILEILPKISKRIKMRIFGDAT